MRFLKEKVHSLSVAPEPLAIWNKKLEVLESELFERTVYLSFCSPRAYIRVVFLGRTRMQSLGVFSDSLLLLDIVQWWWLSVNAFCSRVVLCWYILPNVLVVDTVPSWLSPFSLNSVFSLCPLLGLFRWCSWSMCTAPLIYKYPPRVLAPLNILFKTFVITNMVVCEVEQPPSMFRSSCVSCRSWRKSCDRD